MLLTRTKMSTTMMMTVTVMIAMAMTRMQTKSKRVKNPHCDAAMVSLMLLTRLMEKVTGHS